MLSIRVRKGKARALSHFPSPQRRRLCAAERESACAEKPASMFLFNIASRAATRSHAILLTSAAVPGDDRDLRRYDTVIPPGMNAPIAPAASDDQTFVLLWRLKHLVFCRSCGFRCGACSSSCGSRGGGNACGSS